MTQHTPHSPSEIDHLRTSLFDALDSTRVGMLGTEGSYDHMQPMTHFFDRDSQTLWFISGRSTDLVKHLASPQHAFFTIADAQSGTYACLMGQLGRADDPDKLEELWSPAAAMWFEGGIDDPEVALLRMPLAEASVWQSDANALQFGIEMLRGTVSDHEPEVGRHAVIKLAA